MNTVLGSEAVFHDKGECDSDSSKTMQMSRR